MRLWSYSQKVNATSSKWTISDTLISLIRLSPLFPLQFAEKNTLSKLVKPLFRLIIVNRRIPSNLSNIFINIVIV